MMAGEETVKSCASGFRFNPLDQELITHYLKPMILGKQLPCNIIKYRQVYGPSSNPWHVFDPNQRRSWFISPDIKLTEKFTFVFAKLSKLSNSITSKNTSKNAGCGTWVGKTKHQIRDVLGNVIGEKRYLVFEIQEIDSAAAGAEFDFSKVGFYKMHEYRLCGVNEGLGSAQSIVLCKITHDSSKECPITVKSGTKSGDHVSKSSSVTTENLTVIDTSGGDKLDESRTLNSESLVAQYNNSIQESDDFGGSFCFDDLGGYDFSFDDLGGCDKDWMMVCLDTNQEEKSFEDNTTRKLGKRKF